MEDSRVEWGLVYWSYRREILIVRARRLLERGAGSGPGCAESNAALVIEESWNKRFSQGRGIKDLA